MPELPEVESVARSLRPKLVGREVLAVESSGLPLRRPIELARLRAACTRARVEGVRRLGKYLLVDLSSAQVLLVHLGMSGRLLFRGAEEAREAHTHAVFKLDGGLDLRYVDPRRFGVLRVYPRAVLERAPELAVLGLDPFDPRFTAAWLHAELKRTQRDLKAFLLDQGRIAGLGNIYVCEALHLSRLSPTRRAHRVTAAEAARLHAAVREVLHLGIDNRGTSFSDYVDADGLAGNNVGSLRAYGREGAPCPVCKHAITRRIQANRSTFYCRRCQR